MTEDLPPQFRDAGPYRNRYEDERAADAAAKAARRLPKAEAPARRPSMVDTACTLRYAAEGLADVLRDRLENAPHDALTATEAAMLAHCEAVIYHADALERLNGGASWPQVTP